MSGRTAPCRPRSSRCRAGAGCWPPSTSGSRCSAPASPPSSWASTFAVAAIGADFSWTGAGVAAVATVGAGAALTVVGAGIGAAIGNAPAALTGTYLVLLVGMTVLSGAKPTWGKHVDPLAAMFDLVEGDATARPIAVLAGWLVVTAVAGIAVTRRRAVS